MSNDELLSNDRSESDSLSLSLCLSFSQSHRFDAAPGAGSGPSGLEALQALPAAPSHSPSPANTNGQFNQGGGDLLDLI